jgi:heme/copper-type cytochrome/quinol oxidase subunit 3
MNEPTGAPISYGGRVSSPKLGMWLFLATEVMLFTSLIGAFLNMKWRSPPDANHILNIPLTAANTFVLIVSSTAVVFALAAAQDGKQKRLRLFLMLTWVLGAVFLGIQVREYTKLLQAGLTPSSSLFGGGFYTLTGLHGFHVLVGISWLLVLIILSLRGRISSAKSLWIEIFGLYWHFVDVVWIVLFTIVYLL